MIVPSLAWIVMMCPFWSNLASPTTTCSPAIPACADGAANRASSRGRASERVRIRLGWLRGCGLLEHECDQRVELGLVAAARSVGELAARPREIDAGAHVAQELDLGADADREQVLVALRSPHGGAVRPRVPGLGAV